MPLRRAKRKEPRTPGRKARAKAKTTGEKERKELVTTVVRPTTCRTSVPREREKEEKRKERRK
eukprot:536199-Amphidinium_carterae.1